MNTNQIRSLSTRPCTVNVRGSNRDPDPPAAARPRPHRASHGASQPCAWRDTASRGEADPLRLFPSHVRDLARDHNGGRLTRRGGDRRNEGMVGTSLLMGASESTVDAFAQVSGDALRMTRSVVKNELSAGGIFPDLMRRYGEAYVTQVSQSAACNPPASGRPAALPLDPDDARSGRARPAAAHAGFPCHHAGGCGVQPSARPRPFCKRPASSITGAASSTS